MSKVLDLDPEWLKANDIDPIGVRGATIFVGFRVDVDSGKRVEEIGWLIEVTRSGYIRDLNRSIIKERFVVPCKVMPAVVGEERNREPEVSFDFPNACCDPIGNPAVKKVDAVAVRLTDAMGKTDTLR